MKRAGDAGEARESRVRLDRMIPADVKAEGSPSLKTVWSLLKVDVLRNIRYLIADCLLLLPGIGLGFLQPSITRHLIDVAIPGKDVRAIMLLALLLIAAAVTSRAMGAVLTLLRTKFIYLIQSALLARAFRATLDSPFRIISRLTTGEVLTTVTQDASALVSGLSTVFRILVGSSYSLIFATVLLWRTSPLILLFLVVASGVRFPIQRWLARMVKQQTGARQKWFSRLSTVVVESLTGFSTVKLNGLEETRCDDLVDTVKRSFSETYGLDKKIQAISMLDVLVGAAVPAVIFGYGGYLVVTGKGTIGSVLAAIQYATYGITSFDGILGLYAQYKPLYVHVERLQKLLSLPNEYGCGVVPEFNVVDRMDFSRVTFRHEHSPEALLKDISLSMRRGEIVGLVGPSGGGKTTMGYMVAGAFEPEKGKIVVNGCDLRSLSMKWYRERVALVTDGDFIFMGTIAENLRIVSPRATDEDIEKCLEISLLKDVVMGLPQGLDTVVGRAGVTLSAGQRQRVSLGRAILRDPQILVLDEVTSNLDSELERHLHERLEHWMRERVVLLISHRASTVAWADRVIELREGCLSWTSSQHLDGDSDLGPMARARF
jgi:ABC-type multidrug transport system fused ATPase/permease subunit